MANLKRFTFKDSWKDWELTLEVDLDVLTQERATEINQFWGGDDGRLRDADDSVINAVVKLAAKQFVYALLRTGGGIVNKDEQAAIWTLQDLHEEEGWGGSEPGSRFGWCGIRLVDADVQIDLDLEEQ